MTCAAIPRPFWHKSRAVTVEKRRSFATWTLLSPPAILTICSVILSVLPVIESVIARGDTKVSVVLASGIQCDLRAVTTLKALFALNYFTGSKEHNVCMRTRALERGWSLNEYRFSKAEGRELKRPLFEVYSEPGYLPRSTSAISNRSSRGARRA